MPDLICVKEIYDAHRKANLCRCPWCRNIRDHLDALEFYREDWGPGLSHYQPFPEKEENLAVQ